MPDRKFYKLFTRTVIIFFIVLIVSTCYLFAGENVSSIKASGQHNAHSSAIHHSPYLQTFNRITSSLQQARSILIMSRGLIMGTRIPLKKVTQNNK